MKILTLTFFLLVLAGCQSTPNKGSSVNNQTNKVDLVKIAYISGFHRYAVDNERITTKMSVEATKNAKLESDKLINQNRNLKLQKEVQTALRMYAEVDGWFVWKIDTKQFKSNPNIKSQNLNLATAEGLMQQLLGSIGGRAINAKAKVIRFGALTDRSIMITIAPMDASDESSSSITTFNEAVNACGSPLPYAFGDIHLISQTTNPAVAAKQVCIVEKSQSDAFTRSFYDNALSIKEQIEGAQIAVN